MAAIAYITDSKMLDHHRLNADTTMNFWRLSPTLSFSNFKVGDLIFFLSKDKIHMRDGEKGIVGYGRVESLIVNSVNTMWNKFEQENGYNTCDEFKEAILKVSKDHKLPSKISSFYLKDVVFFQAPAYLSEFGMPISNNVESYVYINPEEIVIKLLEYAKDNVDLWSGVENVCDKIDDEELKYAIRLAHNRIGDFNLCDKQKKAIKIMHKVKLLNPELSYVGNSILDLTLVNERNVLIVLFNDNNMDIRLLIGQCELYRKYIGEYYPNAFKLYFKVTNNDKDVEYLLNKFI